MNIIQRIEVLRKEGNVTKPEAGQIVDLFFNEITDALSKGDGDCARDICHGMEWDG
jgi:nucleoid DNA-binding protein